ncbi:SPOSA6832_00330 [Sporobolomyces salmonicolor]|uniref:SPOSA6832_00330-mRNA-1:cds n=1 Tax=Sporidiobolus salmonicolor TaxID=5005 RepID=A0A0D6EFR5_SPOSA|nr:SPOSA6832_00330 [Sporobolomyces salmonicolor]
MRHATRPSIDLEGGSRRPISARPPNLILRTSPRQNLSDLSEEAASPRSPAYHSPQYLPPLSPITDNVNHFTTLPPSPPRSIPPSPPLAAGPQYTPGAGLRLSQNSAYSTPPMSAPGSANTALDMNGGGVPQLPEAGRSSSILLGEDLLHSNDPYAKRRPSLILTSAPLEESQGLALGVDMSQPLPSPRLRRSYPAGSSPVPSPTTPHSPYFSTSPVNSPTLGSFPSPLLAAGSPTFGSSATMERAPSSPRLSTITDPLGRLATGLIRRASNTSLNANLPTSVQRSPSPSRAASSPTLASGPSLSPILGGGSTRRTSFAAQAREKEKEKEKELKERELKKRVEKFHHARGFSWTAPAGSKLGKAKTGAGPSSKKRVLMAGLLVVGLCIMFFKMQSGSSSDVAVQTDPTRPTAVVGSRLRRLRGGGRQFIHPEVVERPAPPSKSLAGAPWRWLRRFFVLDRASLPAGYRPGAPNRRKKMEKAADRGDFKEAKRRSVFVASPHVQFVDHEALPPPIEHSDAPERDTLVLYRILGNDLPPRHSPGQTLRNLRFLLQHESDFSILPPLGPHGLHHSHLYGSGRKAQAAHTQMGGLRVDKYFVLNRIAEPEMVSAIIGLLHLYSVPDSRILIIPFEWDEYQRREFRWDGGVDAVAGWGIGGAPVLRPSFGKDRWQVVMPEDALRQQDQRMADLLEEADGEEAKEAQAKKRKSETLARLRALDFTYHEKNLYAMNNNGGRNFALQHGRSLPNARWILPLDGNSFFTPAAMYSIVKTLSIAGEGPAASRYLVIPMARLLNNDDVRKNNSVSLVPLDAVEEGASAALESEIHHRPKAAPETPEEPQIGFRYDSTESFQEAMRYGRRSKLELLWRLGAIPYSRALDRRTLPWEVTDRAHITATTWGSIPGAESEHTKDSIIHHPHGDFDPDVSPNPERGALAFVKAGWVYRLFSGHKSQEEHNSEAVTLRNMNRIRGIVAFLERLDEKVARGQEGCTRDENPSNCGFKADRLWNFDQFAVERLRQKYKLHRRDALEKVDRYEGLIRPVYSSVVKLLKDGDALRSSDAQGAATNSTLLAMAAYLTGNFSYSAAAADLIGQRFVRQTPLFYRQFDQRQQLRRFQDLPDNLKADHATPGYTFPPFPADPGQASTWSAEFARMMLEPSAPPLAFDPLSFDVRPLLFSGSFTTALTSFGFQPILLLDAVRLLNSPNSPRPELSTAASRKAVTPVVASHLSWLLYAPAAVEFSRDPPSAEDGAYYDAKVAALAAYLDDARLLGRVANRARLRLPVEARAEGLMHAGRAVREIHFRLIQGLSNVALRPWNLASDPIAQGMYLGSAHGNETPLDVLGV